MLIKLIDRFGTTFYVQVWENRLKITDARTGSKFDEKPLMAVKTEANGKKNVLAVGNAAESYRGTPNTEVLNPFSHSRQLLCDFIAASALLQAALRQLFKGKLFSPRPAICIHPMEKCEGGLTAVERRGFRELCLSAGARDVKIYEGPELTARGLVFDSIKEDESQALSSTDIPSRGYGRLAPTLAAAVWLVILGIYILFKNWL